MTKIFCVYAARTDLPDGGAEAALDLPASPYEILDARDMLRLKTGESMKFRVEECYRFPFLAPFLSGQNDIYELNALAQKLSELDERQETAVAGLLQITLRTKERILDLPGLIDLAYSTGCCHVVEEARNDSQLGRFCAENGLYPGLKGLPDNIFDLLDFERIGREHRQAEGGVFAERGIGCSGGYVEQHAKLLEVSKTLDRTPKMPDYAILLNVSKGFFNDPGYDSGKTAPLKLPASPETLDAVL